MQLLDEMLLLFAADDDTTDSKHRNVCHSPTHAGSYVFQLSRSCSYSLETK